MDDLVVPMLILIVGVIGLAIGISCAGALEGGLGTLMTIFGAYATITTLRAR